MAMKFFENELYHIYNRGNNKGPIFFKPENYLYFLKKVRKYILPFCDILSYCLMPNHFDFLINSDKRTVGIKSIGGIEKNVFSESIRNLLSSYTRGINKQNNSTGSLFQQNTKARLLTKEHFYALNCFHYIHQMPMKEGLVKKMEDWPYSSFNDYCGFRNGTLCNKRLTFTLLDLNPQTLYDDSYKTINSGDLKDIL